MTPKPKLRIRFDRLSRYAIRRMRIARSSYDLLCNSAAQSVVDQKSALTKRLANNFFLLIVFRKTTFIIELPVRFSKRFPTILTLPKK